MSKKHDDLNDADRMEERPELDQKLSELEILRQSLDDVKAKQRDTFDQLLRLTAEYQNFRRRSETQIAESRRAGKSDVLMQVIQLSDALIQAELACRTATDAEAIKKGLSMVHAQFDKFLKEQGLEAIKAKGEKLDPHKHEALSRIVNNDLEEGTVVDEIQRGYTMNGQVVRPSRVVVSAKEAAKTE